MGFFENDEWYHYKVQKLGGENIQYKLHDVKFSKNPINGSFCGSCTCCAPQVNGIPCSHMVAVSMTAHNITNMRRINIMPVWWTTKKWRLRFPTDTYPKSNITMKIIMETACQNNNRLDSA